MIGETAMHCDVQQLERGIFRHKLQPGFTLIELMVTIAVMAILLAVAAPSFNDVTLNSRLGSYANNFVASANLARSEAIKRNAVVVMCVSSDGVNCTTTGGWEQGWIVGCRTTNPSMFCDGSGPDWIILHQQKAFNNGFKMSETSASTIRSIDFMPTGAGATQATFSICRAEPHVGISQRQVTISATGRASVVKSSSSTCS